MENKYLVNLLKHLLECVNLHYIHSCIGNSFYF